MAKHFLMDANTTFWLKGVLEISVFHTCSIRSTVPRIEGYQIEL